MCALPARGGKGRGRGKRKGSGLVPALSVGGLKENQGKSGKECLLTSSLRDGLLLPDGLMGGKKGGGS